MASSQPAAAALRRRGAGIADFAPAINALQEACRAAPGDWELPPATLDALAAAAIGARRAPAAAGPAACLCLRSLATAAPGRARADCRAPAGGGAGRASPGADASPG